MMSLLLAGALTLGLGAIVLFGLWSICRGLICESSIDAPSMPDAKATREDKNQSQSASLSATEFDERALPKKRPLKVGSSPNGRRFNNQASSTPTLE
jgi:hypothetical protein